MFADFLQSLRLVLTACAALAAAAAVALLGADGFWLLLIVALVQAAFALLHLACKRMMAALFQPIWPQPLKLHTRSVQAQ